MQAGGTLPEASTISPRGRLNALLAMAAVIVIAVAVALLVWAGPMATSEVGTEDAMPKAASGSAVVHDDAGNILPDAGAGSVVTHDDAGYVNR